MAGSIIFSVVGRSLRQTVVKEKTIIDSRWLWLLSDSRSTAYDFTNQGSALKKTDLINNLLLRIKV